MAATIPPAGLPARQFARLRALLDRVPENPFYRGKYAGSDLTAVRSLADLSTLPFTTKAELTADQAAHPPYGTNLGRPLADYVRLHQTSGTATGQPLRWLDTTANWESLLRTWQTNFRLMGVTAADRIAFPFSFGPFLGFWTAFEAATRLGALAIPCGGMSTTVRLRVIREHAATVVCCTPTYALRMAEVAEAEGFDLAGSSVRAIVVAGEPGGSLPALRKQLQDRWGARVYDHYGLTETGPIANEAEDCLGGMFADGEEFIVEVIDPESAKPVEFETPGELIVTNLGRGDSPLIRYRTGDVVQLGVVPGRGIFFEGGIRGRVDDMIQVRGNNFYPSAVEEVVRRFPGVAEFRIVLDKRGPLADLTIEVEWNLAAEPALPGLERAIREALLFRAAVLSVPPGTLPRSEMKSRRVFVRPL